MIKHAKNTPKRSIMRKHAINKAKKVTHDKTALSSHDRDPYFVPVSFSHYSRVDKETKKLEEANELEEDKARDVVHL